MYLLGLALATVSAGIGMGIGIMAERHRRTTYYPSDIADAIEIGFRTCIDDYMTVDGDSEIADELWEKSRNQIIRKHRPDTDTDE